MRHSASTNHIIDFIPAEDRQNEISRFSVREIPCSFKRDPICFDEYIFLSVYFDGKFREVRISKEAIDDTFHLLGSTRDERYNLFCDNLESFRLVIMKKLLQEEVLTIITSNDCAGIRITD